ncbi:MAG: hypothetical protein OCD00_12285 [Colwellia sp.]
MQPAKHNKKHFWQKISSVIGKLSFLSAAIGVVLIMLYIDEISEVYKASLGACTFICFALGIVFNAMGNTSIPDLKPDND